MPELPELEGLAAWVNTDLAGRRVDEVRLRSVAALKTFDPPISTLAGRTVGPAGRRGKYLHISMGDLLLVTHLSLGGWLRWSPGATTRKPSLRGPIIAEVRLDGGSLDLTEHGKEKRLAIWVVRRLEDVPRIGDLGPEPLDPNLALDDFTERVRAAPGTIKHVLADQRVIAGIGNAYSDDILHAARLSPFLRAARLDGDQIGGLYEAMRTVLNDAVAESVGVSGGKLKEIKRAHFRVHGRAGAPCPACGDAIRPVWMGERSFEYCPNCQTGGRVYADRRLSRFLK